MAHILFEVKEIKQRVQQGLVNALTNFHKRRLRAKERGLTTNSQPVRIKQVNGQPLKGKHSTNIDKNSDKIAQ